MAAPIVPLFRPRAGACVLAGHAAVRLAPEQVAAVRRAPGPPCGEPVPFPLLKHADEQTVAGVSAVLHAIDAFNLAPDGTHEVFRAWGVLAAPRFLGRDNIARMVAEFRTEGPFAVSPHAIPTRTMHSPSGTLSLVLGIRGPNHGAGGGPGAEAEGLLSAFSLLVERRLPGLWVLLSRVEPLTAPDFTGGLPPGTHAEAVALALVPVGTRPGPVLELLPGDGGGPPFTLDALRGLLERGGSCPLPGFGRLVLRPAEAMAAAG